MREFFELLTTLFYDLSKNFMSFLTFFNISTLFQRFALILFRLSSNISVIFNFKIYHFLHFKNFSAFLKISHEFRLFHPFPTFSIYFDLFNTFQHFYQKLFDFFNIYQHFQDFTILDIF